MSAGHSVHTDNSRLSQFDQQLFKLESALNLVGGIVVLFLMMLAVAQIFGRKLFNMPVPGFIDWVEQSMAVFAFVGISYCQRIGGHIRMDILIGRLRGRALWLAELASLVVMILLTTALTYGSWLHFLRAWTLGDSSIDIALPIWPAKLIVPVALSLLTLRFLLQAWSYMRAFRYNQTTPIAVPMIEDAATIAAKEAKAVLSENGNISR